MQADIVSVKDLNELAYERLRQLGYILVIKYPFKKFEKDTSENNAGVETYYQLGDAERRIKWARWGKDFDSSQPFLWAETYQHGQWHKANELDLNAFATSPNLPQVYVGRAPAICMDVSEKLRRFSEEARKSVRAEKIRSSDFIKVAGIKMLKPKIEIEQSDRGGAWNFHFGEDAAEVRADKTQVLASFGTIKRRRLRVLSNGENPTLVFEEHNLGSQEWRFLHQTTASQFMTDPRYAFDVDMRSLEIADHMRTFPKRNFGQRIAAAVKVLAAG